MVIVIKLLLLLLLLLLNCYCCGLYSNLFYLNKYNKKIKVDLYLLLSMLLHLCNIKIPQKIKVKNFFLRHH
jgi:hypothetical protein